LYYFSFTCDVPSIQALAHTHVVGYPKSSENATNNNSGTVLE